MITRCENGHWYDDSINRVCPHCKRESEKLGFSINDDIEEDDHTISLAEVDESLGEELSAIIGGVSSYMPLDMVSEGENPDDDKTISFGLFGVFDTIQPVTGWLVCIEGEEKGKDYRLHSGKNFIGRSTSMDVVLVDDKSISRDRHCSVVYDPKGGKFYLSIEKGNITYLNGMLLEQTSDLSDGDVIEIGNTKLQFIPFCKGERSWEIG